MATMSAGTTALEPPRPEPDEITRFFWEGVDQHRLLILDVEPQKRCLDQRLTLIVHRIGEARQIPVVPHEQPEFHLPVGRYHTALIWF